MVKSDLFYRRFSVRLSDLCGGEVPDFASMNLWVNKLDLIPLQIWVAQYRHYKCVGTNLYLINLAYMRASADVEKEEKAKNRFDFFI